MVPFLGGSWALALTTLLPVTSAFYIPGFSQHVYAPSEPIPLLYNKVYSSNTQLQYSYASLPFVCPPSGSPKRFPSSGLLSGQPIPLNLGEVLRGDRIVVSDLELRVQRDNACKVLCEREMTLEAVKQAREMIRDEYLVEWIVDNLPGATSYPATDRTKKHLSAGFKLGYMGFDKEGKARHYLHNHHTVVIRYAGANGRGAGEIGAKVVVVGFEVYPASVDPRKERSQDGCPKDLESEGWQGEGLELGNSTLEQLEAAGEGATVRIPYTYSVYFRENEDIEWRQRWDLYFVDNEAGSRVHWMSIINSLVICGMLTGIVLMILARTLQTDLKVSPEAGKKRGESKSGLLDQVGRPGARTVLEDDEEDLLDDDLEDVTGWKLLHGDVFRPPAYSNLLSSLVGSGMQLLFMAVGLVLLSAFGILNPSFRGGFISFGVGLFVFAGIFSGYFSARVYKTLGGRDWRANVVMTAVLFPGLLFAVMFILNLFVWSQASSTAMPFSTLASIVALWLCVQLPLVYAGAWWGYVKRGAWENPTKTSGGVPRQVPRQPWYLRGWRAALLAGLVPFLVIFIELLFVFRSVWQDKSGYYYVFGFLSVVLAILVVTIAEVTVVMMYLQMCAENYHWWWQSFWVGGGSAAWVYLYSVWYYFAKLHIKGLLSAVLFFSYSFMACCMFGLLTGTVGFLTAYAFVRRIYGAIKVD